MQFLYKHIIVDDEIIFYYAHEGEQQLKTEDFMEFRVEAYELNYRIEWEGTK